jgi:hypothetical protein
VDRELKLRFTKLALTAGGNIARNYKKEEKTEEVKETNKIIDEIKGFRDLLLNDLRKAGAVKRTELEKCLVTKKFSSNR